MPRLLGMNNKFCIGSPKLNEITENKHSLFLTSAATCWVIRKYKILDQSCLVPVIQATVDGLLVLYIVCWYALDPSHRQWSLDVAWILWMKMSILLWPHLLIDGVINGEFTVHQRICRRQSWWLCDAILSLVTGCNLQNFSPIPC